jgi:hypothetical protein
LAPGDAENDAEHHRDFRRQQKSVGRHLVDHMPRKQL